MAFYGNALGNALGIASIYNDRQLVQQSQSQLRALGVPPYPYTPQYTSALSSAEQFYQSLAPAEIEKLTPAAILVFQSGDFSESPFLDELRMVIARRLF